MQVLKLYPKFDYYLGCLETLAGDDPPQLSVALIYKYQLNVTKNNFGVTVLSP